MSDEPRYRLYAPATARCEGFSCNEETANLCWRCHRPTCLKHTFLVRYQIYCVEPVIAKGRVLDVIEADEPSLNETGTLWCIDCIRRIPGADARIAGVYDSLWKREHIDE